MKNLGWVSILAAILVLSTNLVSALYLPYPFSAISYYLTPYTLTMITIFVLIFAFVFFSINRLGFFRDYQGNPHGPTAAVVAFLIALTTVYWMSWNGFDPSYLIYWLQYSGYMTFIVIAVIILFSYLVISGFRRKKKKRYRILETP